jgi:hypothetical protein
MVPAFVCARRVFSLGGPGERFPHFKPFIDTFAAKSVLAFTYRNDWKSIGLALTREIVDSLN